MMQPTKSNDPRAVKFIEKFANLLDNHDLSILKHGFGAGEYTVISLKSKTILKLESSNNDIVLIAGLSEKSVSGTVAVLLSAREYVNEKNIHIVFHSSGSVEASKMAFKECQVLEIEHEEELRQYTLKSVDLERREKNGENIEEEADILYNEEMILREKVYGPELEFSRKCGDTICDIIRELGCSPNIVLALKCFGFQIGLRVAEVLSGVVEIRAGVPSCSTNVKSLLALDEERLKSMKFVFGWRNNDGRRFLWGVCRDEKKVYDWKMKSVDTNYMSVSVGEDYTFEMGDGVHEAPIEIFDN